ncbi:MAG: putative sulfate exporter family transporter [Alphaproteobacteria bacterium]|nr:putative sulfate exporter family transporter [Alphaproteobacteria bacterium]
MMRVPAISRPFITGITLSVGLAATATFVAKTLGGPALLYALLLGMCFKLLGDKVKSGVTFSGRTILRIGVALLGFRIAVSDLLALGIAPALLIIAAVTLTILFGAAFARALGLKPALGILTGGATAICGASAAMAIGTLLPRDKIDERDITFAVVAVTTLSTLSMVLYPPVIHALGLGDMDAGFIIGATIHDVAQVVGAGYMVSPAAGDHATVTKLFRIALLVPVTTVLAAMFASGRNGAKGPTSTIPWFLILFVVFAGIRSTGIVPDKLVSLANDASRWCLCIAIAAVGLKTSVGDMRSLGFKALLLAIAETLFLITVVVLGMLYD